MGTHAERRQAGLRTLSEMTGGDGFATAAERSGAFGGYVVDYVFGQVWQGSELSRRDRNLAALAMLGALDRYNAFRVHVGFTEANGLSREEVTEVALQVAGYSGFPAGSELMGVLQRLWSEVDGEPYRFAAAERKDDEQRHRDAVDVQRTLTGRETAQDPGEALAGMERIGPVGKLAFEFAFGDLWSRPELSRRDRSLVVVSILVALNKPDELQFHIPGALNHGVTETELAGVMATAAPYCGFPRAVEGYRTLRRILREREEAHG